MPQALYRGRRATSIENDFLRVTVLHEGGHIAELFDKRTGINPLWTPPWPSIEPSTYDAARHPEYGADSESKLLSGIMGHNLCLDTFGAPSPEEAAAGMTVHGEASIALHEVTADGPMLTQRAHLRQAQLRFERQIRLEPGSAAIEIAEAVENESACDRPIAWTEHVTLGPPFLAKGRTQFRAPATRSQDFASGGIGDLRVFISAASSGGFTTHLMDPGSDTAWFLAWSPESGLAIGYSWQRADFPWLGVWEENYLRTAPPWNRRTLTRGMEFGASPMPESRRQMIERGSLFGVPGYRWIPAAKRVEVRYRAALLHADAIPEGPL